MNLCTKVLYAMVAVLGRANITFFYKNRSDRSSAVLFNCNLCIAEKYYIICHPKEASLNKRTELISKCRHRDKFLLRNVK